MSNEQAQVLDYLEDGRWNSGKCHNLFTSLVSSVVYNTDGRATSPPFAEKHYGVRADIVYVREDGWVVGAPFMLELVLHEQHLRPNIKMVIIRLGGAYLVMSHGTYRDRRVH